MINAFRRLIHSDGLQILNMGILLNLSHVYFLSEWLMNGRQALTSENDFWAPDGEIALRWSRKWKSIVKLLPKKSFFWAKG